MRAAARWCWCLSCLKTSSIRMCCSCKQASKHRHVQLQSAHMVAAGCTPLPSSSSNSCRSCRPVSVCSHRRCASSAASTSSSVLPYLLSTYLQQQQQQQQCNPAWSPEQCSGLLLVCVMSTCSQQGHPVLEAIPVHDAAVPPVHNH
jgi:hypothetical protein